MLWGPYVIQKALEVVVHTPGRQHFAIVELAKEAHEPCDCLPTLHVQRNTRSAACRCISTQTMRQYPSLPVSSFTLSTMTINLSRPKLHISAWHITQARVPLLRPGGPDSPHDRGEAWLQAMLQISIKTFQGNPQGRGDRFINPTFSMHTELCVSLSVGWYGWQFSHLASLGVHVVRICHYLYVSGLMVVSTALEGFSAPSQEGAFEKYCVPALHTWVDLLQCVLQISAERGVCPTEARLCNC